MMDAMRVPALVKDWSRRAVKGLEGSRKSKCKIYFEIYTKIWNRWLLLSSSAPGDSHTHNYNANAEEIAVARWIASNGSNERWKNW